MYKIVRRYVDEHRARTIETGLTLAQAQEHCNDPETSSRTCISAVGRARTRKMGAWFDSYENMDRRSASDSKERQAPPAASGTSRLTQGTLRRVQITKTLRSGYFTKGQFAYVIGQNDTGGMVFADKDGFVESAPGEWAYTWCPRPSTGAVAQCGSRRTASASRLGGGSRASESIRLGETMATYDQNTHPNPTWQGRKKSSTWAAPKT